MRACVCVCSVVSSCANVYMHGYRLCYSLFPSLCVCLYGYIYICMNIDHVLVCVHACMLCVRESVCIRVCVVYVWMRTRVFMFICVRVIACCSDSNPIARSKLNNRRFKFVLVMNLIHWRFEDQCTR